MSKRIFAPNIILTKNVEGEIKLKGPRLQGIVTVERFRGDHRLGLLTGKWVFKNHITDAGLDAIKPSDGTDIPTILNFMGVGTDSTAPTDGDTSLGAEIAPAATHRTNNNGSIADVTGFGTSFAYAYLIRTRLFLEAQANGNLTEMGWFTASTGGTMFSRMLFKDGGGTPTTIVKTASDQLRVTYEVRIYPPVSDLVDVATISGNNYDYTIRAAEIDSAWTLVSRPGGFGGNLGSGGTTLTGKALETQTIGAATGVPAGSQVSPTSVTWASYTNGTFFRDATYVWDPGIANFAGGIGSLLLSGGNNGGGQIAPLYQLAFHTTALPKDNTKRLTLTFRQSWARYP